MNYWLNLFTLETWHEFKAAGGEITGFREGRWSRARNIQPGDKLLCYVVGLYRWIGVLEVTGNPYKDDSDAGRIWKKDIFPSRVPVRIVSELDPETAVPVLEMIDELEITSRLKNKARWGTQFMGSPEKWSEHDGSLIEQRIQSALSNPVRRPVPLEKISTGDVVYTPDGVITLPAEDELEQEAESSTDHTRLQHLLARMGSSMGYDVFVPAADRRKSWKGESIESLPNLVTELKLPLIPEALRIVREIDVLWLDSGAVVAAFEIERTTSVYSGLLRMSDLLALQPNLSIDCFIVAPDEKRDRVIAQVNRATFARMKTPLSSICRYIPFSDLISEEGRESGWRHQRFSYVVDELSETLEPSDV